MKAFTVVLTAVFTVCSGATFGAGFNICREDHIPPPYEPPLSDKIGEVAGFQVLGMFLSLGGFGCPGDVMAQIRQLSADYEVNEYAPRYAEAAGIHDWLDATHDVYAAGEVPRNCPVCGFPHNVQEFRALVQEKLARRNELSAQIDAIWADLALEAWVLIPQPSRDAYLAWYDALPGGE